MYSVVRTGQGIKLQGPQASAEILQECGAILNRWEIPTPQGVLQAIEGYASITDFARHAESKGFRSCKLSPYVCRLRNSRYTFNGQEYQIGKFVLNGHVIHGLLYDVPFDVVSSHADEQQAMVVLQHAYTGNDAGYPYTYTLTVTYVMQGLSLRLQTEVHNTSTVAIPISDGWHPYFNLGAKVDELEFYMAANQRVEFDDELLPNGELSPYPHFNQPALLGNIALDNCFLLPKPLQGPACTLRNKATGVQLSITPGPAYPFLQLYIPPHRQSIAIENLSSAPDAFNNHMGLVVLDAGERISFETKYEVVLG